MFQMYKFSTVCPNVDDNLRCRRIWHTTSGSFAKWRK